MLFNSFAFIFVFLPLTWVLAVTAHRIAGIRLEQAAICVASLVFYAVWDVRYIPIFCSDQSVQTSGLVGAYYTGERDAMIARQGVGSWLVSLSIC